MGSVCRYMIIYHYGGVYADMDTVCRKPVEAWAPRGCHFAVATETDIHFCQWAFAGVAGHGALGRVLELVLQRMQARVWQAYIAEDNWEFVHEVTGPSVFTEGILDYLRIPHTSHDDVNLYQLIRGQREDWRQRGVCLLTWAEMQKMLRNKYSSTAESLQDGSWRSWTQEREALMKEAAEVRGSGVVLDEAAGEGGGGGGGGGNDYVIVDAGTEGGTGENGLPGSASGSGGQAAGDTGWLAWIAGAVRRPVSAADDAGGLLWNLRDDEGVARGITAGEGSSGIQADGKGESGQHHRW